MTVDPNQLPLGADNQPFLPGQLAYLPLLTERAKAILHIVKTIHILDVNPTEILGTDGQWHKTKLLYHSKYEASKHDNPPSN